MAIPAGIIIDPLVDENGASITDETGEPIWNAFIRALSGPNAYAPRGYGRSLRPSGGHRSFTPAPRVRRLTTTGS